MDIFNNVSKGLGVMSDINIINQRRNQIKSNFSSDPEERKISIIRKHCKNKLNRLQLKSVFFTSILPLLLIVLFAFTGIGNTTVYVLTGIWLVVGFVWSIWNNAKYTISEFNVNESKDITMDDCGF